MRCEIRFATDGNSDTFCGSGWHKAERHGRWTNGTESTLRLPTTPGATVYRCAISLMPFVNDSFMPLQELIFSVGGTIVLHTYMRDKGQCRFDVPAAAAGNGPAFLLTIRCPHAVAPAAYQKGADGRQLGIYAGGMTVEAYVRPLPKVAICAIVRDEVTYIEEWVEFHRRQGVTAWRIYDNGSVDGTPDVLRRIGIEPIVWPTRPHDFSQQQCAAYGEGGQALAQEADWVAFIDVDEFLFGKDGKPLAAALAEAPSDAGAIAVQQLVFGSSGKLAREPGPVTARFTRCAPRQHPEMLWFKTIARPSCVERHDTAHSVILRSGRYVMADWSDLTRTTEAGKHPGLATRRVEGAIGLHHYILKSREEFLAKSAKWADRLSGSWKRESYFSEREKYANLEECRDLAGTSPDVRVAAEPRSTNRVAAVTMVYNEPDFLPVWLRYYGAQIGAENCFVLDHGSDDGSTNDLGKANRIRIPRSEFDETRRSAAVSSLCASLLQWYGSVIYTDVDEIIVPDPNVAASLGSYCSLEHPEVVTSIGLNLLHRIGHEGPLDLSKPLLRQRSVALPIGSMCKPSLISRPVNWALGFHSCDAPVEFDSLYLFHIAYADYDLAMRRQDKRRLAVADHPYQNHPHKVSNSGVRQWMEEWANMPVEPHESSQEILTEFKDRIISSQSGRENARFRVDLDIKGRALWSIPSRLRNIF